MPKSLATKHVIIHRKKIEENENEKIPVTQLPNRCLYFLDCHSHIATISSSNKAVITVYLREPYVYSKT
jgi:hypothetical protein